MTDSQTLLAEYVQTGSDAAFRELVIRYVDLVYSTALRLVGGDTHCAEDVAQAVFVDLTRMARTLPGDVKLGGWLHRDTCFVAAKLMRGERRRQSRERQAAEMNALQNNSDADYSLVATVLDEVINELEEADRTAILLRFFEQHDFRTLGDALGSTEDAARMRVTRALEKLEGFLKRRGVTTTAASLGVVLSANAIQAAPIGLAVTISTATALAGTTIATAATATVTKAIAMTALQKTIVTATIAVLAGAGIYEARQASQLREQVQTIEQQQAPLTEQIQQLQRERDVATNQMASLTDELTTSKSNTAELPKLRGEVARLRQDSQELARLRTKISQLEDAKATRMKSFKEFQEREALTLLQRMKEGIKLVPGQEQALQDLLLRRADLIVRDVQALNDGNEKEFREQFSQSMSNLSAQIDSLFSPEQQADYKAIQQSGKEIGARLGAAGEMVMMQQLVGIGPEQQDQIYPVLYNFALKRKADDFSDDPEKANALAAVLTPAQMEQYRKFMQGKRVTTQITYPTE